MKSQLDPLASVQEGVHSWAKSLNIPMLDGAVTETGAAVVCTIEIPSPSEVQAFLATSELLRPTLVLIAVTRLSEDDLCADQGSTQPQGAGDCALQALQECRKHIGEVASVAVAVLVQSGSVVLAFSLVAEWHHVVYRDRDEEEPDWLADPEENAKQEERNKWTLERRTEVARKAAADPQFPRCKSEQARLYLLRQLIGEDAPKNQQIMCEIAREAKVIYDFEVKQP